MGDYARQKQRALETLKDLPDRLVCRRCQVSKLNNEFDNRISNLYGKHTICKTCKRDQEKEYYSETPERRKNKLKDNILYKYGLTEEEYFGLLDSQSWRCAICSMLLNYSSYSARPRVDHHHETGKVRSMLCGQCNVGIGHFYENENYLLSAVDYLRKHR